jgi:hypothetical protein
LWLVVVVIVTGGGGGGGGEWRVVSGDGVGALEKEE